jgi:hypothetical protein
MVTVSKICLFSGLFLLATIGASTLAFTEEGTYEQRRACRADAMKFCGKFVPNVQLITACMDKNVHRLSPDCRKQFKRDGV